MIIETERLVIRKATVSDTDLDLYFRLWNNPEVMENVGFPGGLSLSKKEIKKLIESDPNEVFDAKLIVTVRDDGRPIGECKLGAVDDDGVCETDVKLLPEFWGNGFGVEIKQALVDYLFSNTDCTAVKATPNRKNKASIRMQEAVGARRVDKGVHRFPEIMESFTRPVKYYLYLLSREDWKKRKATD